MTTWADVQLMLKPFQVATAEAAIDGLWRDDTTSRFLVADEVGLGKTLVAKGVIAHLIEKLQAAGDERIDIVYICSNTSIARQNLLKLREFADGHEESADRLTKLVAAGGLRSKGVNVVALTPGTSFTFGHRSGQFSERALLYAMLRQVWPQGRELLSKPYAKRFFFYGIGEDSLEVARSRLEDAADDFDQRISVEAKHIVGSLIHRRNTELKSHGRRSIYEEIEALAPAFEGPIEEWEGRQVVIGELRQILAEAGVQLLRPDLVIMDEFQRFADLLDPTATSKSAELLRTFITSEHEQNMAPTKVLLLSATPYRWFDRSDEGSHHQDFISTLRFLFNNQPAPIDDAQNALADLRSAMRRRNVNDARIAAERAGEVLRQVISRTERLSSTPDRNGMLQNCAVSTPIETRDAQGYVAAQQLGDRLGSPWVIELWKTTPWIANLGDGYKMTEELLNRCESEQFTWADPTLLDIGAVGRFDKLDVPNPRLRWLIDRTVNQGWHRLLWMPASRPYYATNNDFTAASKAGITKQLVFSSWRVAPKAIALGLTYAAEQAIAGQRNRDDRPDAATDEWRATAYRSHDRTLLDLSLTTSFLLSAPFSGLAELIDPLELGMRPDGVLRTLNDVRAAARVLLAARLAPITGGIATTSARDVSWYVWAARQLSPADDAWWADVKASAFAGDDKGQRDGLDAHLERFRAPSCPTGPVPDDLIDVLVELSLASPAMCALRALHRTLNIELAAADALNAAARIGWGFRSLLDTPEVINVVEASDAATRAYWQQVLEYAMQGNLQAVLDEYLHMLREWKVGGVTLASSAADIAEAATEALSFRTVTLDTRVPNSDGAGVEIRRLRSRFAVRFGDRSSDQDDDRKDVSSAAFNSPFWPFVMATTSIGQEGLDFHLYSHALIHWNLPRDPVSLEQREGRVHRYKGHAVRKNVAAEFNSLSVQPDDDVWDAMFEQATPDGSDGIVPFWVFEGQGSERAAARVERIAPMIPMSREESQLEQLKQAAATYRMAFGQPRHDDLLEILDGSTALPSIDLSPRSN